MVNLYAKNSPMCQVPITNQTKRETTLHITLMDYIVK